MKSFVQRHADKITGVLSGFDRVRFRGTLRWLANVRGMMGFLSSVSVLLKDFKPYVLAITERLRSAAKEAMAAAGRPVCYLQSSSASKEAVALEVARRDGVRQGPIALLTCVEPCWTYTVGPNRDAKKLELRSGLGKCLHLYFYEFHPQLGFCHTRLQTWFPFTIQICINGREWLARQLDAQGIGYQRRDNCFTAVADVAAAQALFDQQVRTNWQQLLGPMARGANPVYPTLSPSAALDYYWSADETEWATDVMFRSSQSLTALHRRLVHHGLVNVSSGDVMRFLGKHVTAQGHVDARFAGEVVSDLKTRPEGVRIKHRVNRNALKMYDKQGSVLRVETTINDTWDMKVYRQAEGAPAEEPPTWQRLRKGVADLERRTQISQAANERYLEGLATVEETTTLGELTERLSQPRRWHGRQVRALRPLCPDELRWLEAVNRGEFAIHGFRNRDLRRLLFGEAETSAAEQRRRSGKVTRRLRLLRAHGLIQKVPKTHRYQVSPRGQRVIAALLTARQAAVAKLTDAVA